MSGRGRTRTGFITRKDVLAALGVITASAILPACTARDDGTDSGGKAASGPDDVVKFSTFSGARAKALTELWQPVLQDMRQQTGLNIMPYLAADDDSLIEAMRRSDLAAGWVSSASGLKAVRSGEADIFAKAVYPEGYEGTRSVILAHAASRLTLSDLLKCDGSLTLGMGEPQSLSTTQAPYYYLFLANAVNMSTCFKRVVRGKPERNLTDVINRRLDAATHSSAALTELALRDPQALRQIRVIWESPELPTDVLVVRKDLDPVIKEKLRAFFLAYGRAPGAEGERQRTTMGRLALGGFAPADGTHFLPVRLMEAATRLMQAHQTGRPEDVRAAMEELKAIQKEKADHDARIVPQAPADPA